jgi:hypothetical protein
MSALGKLFSKPKDPAPPATMPDPYDDTGKREEERKLRASSSMAQNKLAPVPGTLGREYSRSTLG